MANTAPTVEVHGDSGALGAALAEHVLRIARSVLATEALFLIALSGGSLPKVLGPALAAAIRADPGAAVDLRRWRFCYADERVVPLDHADSNHAACQRDLYAALGVESDTVITIDPLLAPEACASDYAAALAATGKPAPDLALLGMGPDGHTASLFPGHPLVEQGGGEGKAASVAPITDSPKPPPQRVTLTLPALCRAPHVAFLVAGASKAGAVARVMASLRGVGGSEGGSALPAARVRPQASLVWFLDQAAAAEADL